MVTKSFLAIRRKHFGAAPANEYMRNALFAALNVKEIPKDTVKTEFPAIEYLIHHVVVPFTDNKISHRIQEESGDTSDHVPSDLHIREFALTKASVKPVVIRDDGNLIVCFKVEVPHDRASVKHASCDERTTERVAGLLAEDYRNAIVKMLGELGIESKKLSEGHGVQFSEKEFLQAVDPLLVLEDKAKAETLHICVRRGFARTLQDMQQNGGNQARIVTHPAEPRSTPQKVARLKQRIETGTAAVRGDQWADVPEPRDNSLAAIKERMTATHREREQREEAATGRRHSR